MGGRRAWVLVAVHLLLLAHVAWWLWQRRAMTPLEPSESMAFAKEGVVNAGLVLFAGAALTTLIFGRYFCGWACHLVALQDGCRWILLKLGLRPAPLRSRLLKWVPIGAFVYMFLLPYVLRWWEGIPQPGVTRFEWTTSAFWQTFPGWGVGIATLLVCGFALVWFLGSKGFCTYACPYGALFGAADAFAPGRIRVSDACEGCGHCTAVCTSDVRVHQEVREFGMVVDPGCMKCMDCVSACPNEALSFGFGAPAAFAKRRAPAAPRPAPLPWTLDVALLLIFAGSFFVLRDLYGLVPFLLAVGLGVATAWMAAVAWNVLRAPQARFSAWVLKRDGRLRRAGAVFLLLCLVWAGVLGHAGVQRARTLPRNAAFEELRPWMEAVLVGGHAVDGGAPEPYREVGERLERGVAATRASAWLPESRNAWAMAWAHLAQGDRAGFEAEMAEVLRLRPGFGEVLLQRGLVRYWSGDREGARADFAAIRWHDRRHEEAAAFLADLDDLDDQSS
jgi:polyferredoxin